MRSMATGAPITADELLRMSIPDKQVELVRGVLVVREPPGTGHGFLAGRSFRRMAVRRAGPGFGGRGAVAWRPGGRGPREGLAVAERRNPAGLGLGPEAPAGAHLPGRRRLAPTRLRRQSDCFDETDVRQEQR